MRLLNLLESIGINLFTEFEDFEVKGITSDSKSVQDSFIFVAIKGTNLDGHSFIPEAIARGAKAVVLSDSGFIQHPCLSGRQAGSSIQDRAFIKVADTRRALADLSAAFWGHPSSYMKVVGITGTNGKTTVSYLSEAILKQAGFSPGVIGTINHRFKDKIFTAKNTTPGSEQLQALLALMQKQAVDYVLMEVSSHALHQERVNNIRFCAGIFTNLASDHLDYHQNLEAYFSAKSLLFKNLPQEAFAILNIDDERYLRLRDLTCAQPITYGLNNPCDVTARNIVFALEGTEFDLSLNNRDRNLLGSRISRVRIRSLLIGRHNLYNLLAAIAFGLTQGLDLGIIKEAIEKFPGVPGRLERIDTKRDFYVFLDYAHTEDALRNSLLSLRPLAKGRLIIVFGCGGNRDRTKRPRMGEVSSELADFAIITSDNPRNEEPEAITAEIVSGINKNNYKVIVDRKEAIKEALSFAQSNDIILIAGKGHENYQILKDRVIAFDDREVVWECLH